MDDNDTYSSETENDSTESDAGASRYPVETPYTDAITSYLEDASWLTALDAPLKVHARALAKSLDRQLAGRGEIQSALAGSFDKVMVRLDARRPPPAPPTPTLGDSGPMGEQSIFTNLGE